MLFNQLIDEYEKHLGPICVGYFQKGSAIWKSILIEHRDSFEDLTNVCDVRAVCIRLLDKAIERIDTSTLDLETAVKIRSGIIKSMEGTVSISGLLLNDSSEVIDPRYICGYRYPKMDLDGKGEKDGRCEVNACQSDINVIYRNKVTGRYYCEVCAEEISSVTPEVFD